MGDRFCPLIWSACQRPKCRESILRKYIGYIGYEVGYLRVLSSGVQYENALFGSYEIINDIWSQEAGWVYKRNRQIEEVTGDSHQSISVEYWGQDPARNEFKDNWETEIGGESMENTWEVLSKGDQESVAAR